MTLLVLAGTAGSWGSSAAGRPAAPASAALAPFAQASAVGRSDGATPSTIGTRAVDLALVLPRGVRDSAGLTPARVQAQVAAAAAYWRDETAGMVTFSVDRTHGWYRSGLACAHTSALWSQASALFGSPAETFGNAGRHLVIVVPPARAAAAGCGYGFGTQSEGTAAALRPGQGGGTVFVTNTTPSLLAHELGHNLGLDHAGSLTCPGVQDGRYDGRRWSHGCRVREYDDLFDVMGYSSPGYGEGHLNVAHVDELGLEPNAIRTAGPGRSTYLIPALSRRGAPGRGVKLIDGSGAVYYLEYRTATGRDAAAPKTPLRGRPGLRILRADPRLPGSSGSLELDATPPRRLSAAPMPADYDRALPVGGRFVAASGRIAVRLESVSRAGARVTVYVGPRGAAGLGPRPAIRKG